MPDHIPARTAWGEARGEPLGGLQAVLNVVANRARNPGWWGDDFDSVCLRPYQFSCWLPGDPNRNKLLAVTADDHQFEAALRLEAALLRGALEDLTGGADSYYVVGTRRPSWAVAKNFRKRIGHQLFFRTVPLHAGDPGGT